MMPETPSSSSTATIGKEELSRCGKIAMPTLAVDSRVVKLATVEGLVREVAMAAAEEAAMECEEGSVAEAAVSAVAVATVEDSAAEAGSREDTVVNKGADTAAELRKPQRLTLSLTMPPAAANGVRSSLSET